MPGFGLLPTPQFPPMAQPVMPPAAPVQPTFQSPFPVQAEPHLQKPHQQVSSPCSEQTDSDALIHVLPKCVWIVLEQKCQHDQDTAGYEGRHPCPWHPIVSALLGDNWRAPGLCPFMSPAYFRLKVISHNILEKSCSRSHFAWEFDDGAWSTDRS